MSIALLGVDIGTTYLKAVAFAPNGRQLAGASAATQIEYPRPGWAQLHPDTLWHTLVGIIRAVIRQLPAGISPAAIAFSGMAEAGLPMDDKDEPLHPAILWFDRRVLPQMRQWQAAIGAAATARITGLPIASAAGILRLLWLRDNEPALFARTRTWLNLPDYAAYRLCGVKATEYSLASRMMVLDLRTRRWSAELLEQAGMDAALFGELVPSAVAIGQVRREAAELTGLPPGLPVCSAGHDHLCAAAGVGVTGSADLFDSIGTAEAVIANLPAPVADPRIARSGIAQGIHVLPDCCYLLGGLSCGGGSIDWVRRLVRDDKTNVDEAYAAVLELAGRAPTGSGGVFFLPHLRQANPPVPDPCSRGAFIGLSSDTGASHLARAVFEGLAFEVQRILDAVNDHFGLSGKRIVAVGGGARNPLFLQIKADVSGLPIAVPGVTEATCLGAALGAGIGAGIYHGYEQAHEQLELSETVIEPDPSRHDCYRERYEKVFVHLYQTLQTVHHEISAWVTPDK